MERSKHCFQQYSLDYWWLHRNRVTIDTKVETKAKSQILCSPNLNPTPPKNCRNNGCNNEKHGQGTHSTKMGADSPAENTPNASKYVSPKCLLTRGLKA